MNLGRVRVSAIGIVARHRPPCSSRPMAPFGHGMGLPLPPCDRFFVFLPLSYRAVVNQRAKEEYDE